MDSTSEYIESTVGSVLNTTALVTEPPSYINMHWLGHTDVSYTAHVVFGLIITPVMFLSCVGNGLVIYVFTRFKSLRTPANILVVNLAISDLMMAATGYPLFIIASLKGRWIFGKYGCDFYGSAGALFGLMSINSLTAIAVERFCVIYRGTKVSRAQLLVFVALIWIVSLLWAVLPLLGWSKYVLEAYQTTCSFDYFSTNPWDRSFLMSVVVGDFFVPFLVICYCYIQIMFKFKAHQREYQSILNKDSQMSERESSSTSVSSRISRNRRSTDTVRSHLKEKFIKTKKVWSKTEYRIARTVFLVIVVYVISWTPYTIVCLTAQYGNTEGITPTVAMIPIIIAKLSTVYNPFIYAISHPKFKTAIKKIFPVLLCICSSPFKNSGRRNGLRQRDPSPSPNIMLQLGTFQTDSLASDYEDERSSASSQGINVTLEGQTIPADFLMQLLKETAKNTPKGKVTLTFKGGDGPGKLVLSKKGRGKGMTSQLEKTTTNTCDGNANLTNLYIKG